MGLILDSSVLIAAERRDHHVRQALTEIGLRAKGEGLAISVVTLMEMAHGVARAVTPERRSSRRQFLDDLRAAVPVYAVSEAIAVRAGLLDGESEARGVKLGLADLLIGVTALEIGYRVATRNPRHFKLIPGLEVESW